MVCLNIDIVFIFSPTRAEGREVSSACNICYSLLTTLLCFSLSHHFGRVLFNGEGTLVVLFLLVSQPGQLGSGKGACLSVLSFPCFVHFFVLYHLNPAGHRLGWYSVAGCVRRWMASVQSHWQRPGIVPRQKPWGFR